MSSSLQEDGHCGLRIRGSYLVSLSDCVKNIGKWVAKRAVNALNWIWIRSSSHKQNERCSPRFSHALPVRFKVWLVEQVVPLLAAWAPRRPAEGALVTSTGAWWASWCWHLGSLIVGGCSVVPDSATAGAALSRPSVDDVAVLTTSAMVVSAIGGATSTAIRVVSFLLAF